MSNTDKSVKQYADGVYFQRCEKLEELVGAVDVMLQAYSQEDMETFHHMTREVDEMLDKIDELSFEMMDQEEWEEFNPEEFFINPKEVC